MSVISAGALVGLLLTSAVRPPVGRAPDKNGPGVVRVSVVDGSAVVERGDSRVQTDAVRNAPMLPGDFISTGAASRAELQFDGYTAFRLGGSAQARIVSDDPNNRKAQLASGTAEIGMVRDAAALQVDTPSVTVRARQAGDVRISIAADGSSWITARRGAVDVVTPQRTFTLDAGSTLIARGPASQPAITSTSEIAFDSFDDFNVSRDKTMIAALKSSPNLNPALAGYDDLGAYGQWQAVAGYGQSWVPNEPAGWVPYRNGSWSWEDGYGWTWIGSEAWGWTPYHYGNWYYCSCGSSGWAWLPPGSAGTPNWSPALVGFFGFDVASTGGYNNCGGNYGYAPSSSEAPSSSGAPAAPYNNAAPAAPYSSNAPAPYGEGGPSGGGPGYSENPYGEGSGYPPPGGYAPSGYPYPYIGWVPIAPGEPYYPWYPGWAWLGFGWGYGGYGYPGYASVTNITNITRIYRNVRHGGVTATTTRHFRHGTVKGHTVAVNPRDIGHHVGTIHGALPIKPTRNNLAFSHGTVHTPVKFSRAFDSPRFASDKALAARSSFNQPQRVGTRTTHGGVSGHAMAHAPAGRAIAPVSHANVPETRAATVNAPVSRERSVASHQFTTSHIEHGTAYQTRYNAPVTRENAAASRQVEGTRHENAPVTRENMAPVTRENMAPVTRENMAPMTRTNGEAARGEVAPATSWDRFNDARGEARSGGFPAREGAVSAPGEAGRAERAPGDSWGRFSQSRGESYGSMRNQYTERESTPSYSREMPSYSRGSYGSPYSRESEPSYSRGYDPYGRESYPSYSRGSYPSYSHESYPSYSHGSYPSYPRGSYPSYPRGSFGSPPSYSHGNSAPSRPSGGGGGGGGERRGGGGRPPH
ncbi:MAG: FecR domain-containing protein [Candidatus Eremiobacteraeota bacterium]|nr:FecR domain-containing protein [Candidatus Eremiobacteraeota bacterium]